jgi:aryl-alcohol dehydrogenase-like predicted oxidoreductase
VRTRELGETGIQVSAVGLGCGALGDARLTERDVEHLLLGAVDLGVTLFDSARGYGLSEKRLGRVLGGREVVRSTKGGYGIDGISDWTSTALSRGIDAALARLRCERIDLFHLHSCPLEILQRGDLLGALEAARAAGKVRVACYSGDNEALGWAVRSGRFGAVQASVSLYDQRNLWVLEGTGAGVLAKRPLANAPWRNVEPHDDASRAYRERHQRLALDPGGEWDDFAARFAAFAPKVTSILVGTTSLEHLHRAVDSVARGPLEPALIRALHQRFETASAGDWRAMT